MKTYTARYAHLKTRPKMHIGDKIRRGAIIGTMGNSGQSTAAHLHFDCVEGRHDRNWKLSDTEKGIPKASPRQTNFFIDKWLFHTEIAITTFYNDPEYQQVTGKVHLGSDVVPENRDPAFFDIWWNRNKEGTIESIGFDPAYGNYVLISFEA